MMTLAWLVVGMLAVAACFFAWQWGVSKTRASEYSQRIEDADNKREAAIIERDQANKNVLITEGEVKRLTSEVERLKEEKVNQSKLQDKMEEVFKNTVAVALQDLGAKNTDNAKKGILDPMQKEVDRFYSKVDDFLKVNEKNSALLDQRINFLGESVTEISSRANRLADALEGDSKVLGDWGETILKKALENSGISEKHINFVDYQVTLTDEERRLRADAIVKLPDNRELVIDAKVVLKSYKAYHRADDEEKKKLLVGFENAVKTRYEEVLKYTNLKQGKTPGFAVMFLPYESAWHLAISNFSDLFETAQRNRVIITGPTTLMAVLQVVEEMWSAKTRDEEIQALHTFAVKLVKKAEMVARQVDTISKRSDLVSKGIRELDSQLKNSNKSGFYYYATQIQELGFEKGINLPESTDHEVEEIVDVVTAESPKTNPRLSYPEQSEDDQNMDLPSDSSQHDDDSVTPIM